MSMNAKGEGHLGTLARGHLDWGSFDTSKDIFFKMAGPVSITFHVQLSDNRCLNCLGHMNKKVTRSKYGKNLKKILLQNH